MASPVYTVRGQTTGHNVASLAISISGAATDYILLALIYNEGAGSAPATVTSVTSAGMTWVRRKSSHSSASGNLELWWAHGTGALSSYNVTINLSGAYDDCSAIVMQFTGCGSPTAPFDGNASLPAAQSAPTSTWTPNFTGISTSNPDDLLLYFVGSVAASAAPPSGFTSIAQVSNAGGSWGSNVVANYQSVSAVQTNATFNYGSALTNSFGATTVGEAIFDALTADVFIGLSGNIGGYDQYGKLNYGKAAYSWSAIQPTLGASLSVAPGVSLAGNLAPSVTFAANLTQTIALAGGLAPTVTFSAALSVTLPLVLSGNLAPAITFAADLSFATAALSGGLAPQVALGGSLTVILPLGGGMASIVDFAASGLLSGPLWAESAPCPPPMWAEVASCSDPGWIPLTAPGDLVYQGSAYGLGGYGANRFGLGIYVPAGPSPWSPAEKCNG